MKIRMKLQRVMQDVGRERPLLVGEVYDVSDRIAHALIATGAAESAETKRQASDGEPQPSVRRPA